MTNRPFQPIDDGELYDALTPLPSHQDYRRSAPATVRQHGPRDRRQNMLCLVLLILLAGATVVMVRQGPSTSTNSVPSSPSVSATCERAWLDNKDNVYNALRTKAEYMENCITTQKALNQLQQDHR